MLVTPERRNQILTISEYFEPSTIEVAPRQSQEPSFLRPNRDTQVQQLMLSHQDVSGLIHALYPQIQLLEKPSESMDAAQASAPPSTTSSSTLRPASSGIGSNASSMGPNYSGSSVNSEATVTGNGPQYNSNCASHDFPGKGHFSFRDFEATEWNDLASRLRIVQDRLQAIARTSTDPGVEPTTSTKWAIFPTFSDGAISLHPSSPTSGSNIVSSISAGQGSQQSAEATWGYRTLKEAVISLLESHDHGRPHDDSDFQSPGTTLDPLQTLLEDALADATLSLDFGAAHHWCRCLEIWSSLSGSHGPGNLLRDLQRTIARQLHKSISICEQQAQASESKTRSLMFLGQQQEAALSTFDKQRQALRVKMWYASDVRHSSTYEEASLATRALRAMTNPKRNKQHGSTCSWARQRLRGHPSPDRAESQAFEAMTAPKECGGRSKLADDQLEMTSRWLTRNGIENFCKGEERIHRFCYEVQKSVGKLAGASLLESPVLWSSHLFKREKANLDAGSSKINAAPSIGLHTPLAHGGSRPSFIAAQNKSPPVSFPISGNVQTSGTGHLNGFPTGGPNPFTYMSGSPSQRFIVPGMQSPHGPDENVAAIRPGLQYDWTNDHERPSSKIASETEDALVKNIKNSLYGLLASDLGYLLWNQGSETDAWINKAAEAERGSLESSQGPTQSSPRPPDMDSHQTNATDNLGNWAGVEGNALGNTVQQNQKSHATTGFSFSDAYKTLLRRMSTTFDPFVKLQMIYQIESLVLKSIQDRSRSDRGDESAVSESATALQAHPTVGSKSIPRTKATSLEEVIANCTERRAGTLRLRTNQDLTSNPDPTSLDDIANTDTIVNTLLDIFRDPTLRPGTLFLDLQYIAAFIPPSILDHTSQGKAFWDASLAALALKEDLCNAIVRHAAEITNAHITTKPPPPYPTQQEAARLWLVAAKEGSPVAARELGLFYLTHPDLLPQRATMPFAKAKDVFKSAKSGDGGAGSEKERGALDPLTFDVVYHWMEIAANGGDSEARAFLRQGGSV